MEQSAPIRKACDLCYRKRLKCDSQKPRCSHCVVYKSDCTHKAAARKSTPRRGVTSARESALESRVGSLEAQLSKALERLGGLEKNSTAEKETSVSSVYSQTAGTSTRSHRPEREAMPLGSLHETLPIIEWYIATCNSLMPLFDPTQLLTSVKDWYYRPHTREPAVWAMINVVLALAHHNGYPSKNPLSINDTTYLNNAQSILTDSIAHHTTLTHIQVLIGLAMLFRTANEPTPAVVLIATAIRLAHKLGLHKRSSEQVGPVLRRQRERVFWVAYILDRSISSQTKISPVQLDSDIDLDLPPLDPLHDDDAGFVIAEDGLTRFNFFRSSVRMARIQGLVHSYVYSASVQRFSSTEVAHNIEIIHRELDSWMADIPPQFHPSALAQSERYELSRPFCMLYSARLSCRAVFRYGSARDSFHLSNWVESLQAHGERIAAGQGVSRTKDQQGWLTLVTESREYLKLFMTVKSKDAIFTMTTLCAYIVSLICLAANSMFAVHSEARVLDDLLVDAALPPLDEIVKQTGSLRETYDALRELRSYTQGVPRNHESELANHISSWETNLELPDADILHDLFTIPEGGPPWDLQATKM
ncbi:hypothetical protein F4802DRAFT_579447 [Xylaria palmicola]|nr:hypothetical protein F4802DRAFT_579447 [Xylaria palmicola]